MKLRWLLAVSTVFISSAFAQTTFDEHFDLAKQGKLGPREAAFAKQCGVDRATSTITYGRSLDEQWTFKRVSSVGSGRNDAEMDFLGNAEIWSVAGKPRLLNVWFLIMDIGSEHNEMFCLDENGHVVAQETLNVYQPVDGSENGWFHLKVKDFPAVGKPKVVTNTFVSKAGSPIAEPRLSRDDIDDANAGSSPDLAKDLIAKILRKGK